MYAKRKLTDLSIKQAILKAKDSTKTVKTSDGGGNVSSDTTQRFKILENELQD